MNMTQNIPRIGNPTSSSAYKLMTNGKAAGTPGKPFYTYVQEKNWERKLNRSLADECDARALTWGKLVEKKVFDDVLGIEYKECSADTLVHPEIKCWAGSPDGVKFDEGGTVIDIKCPHTLKSYCELYDCQTIEQVRENHKDGEKFYWQLVSNSVLTNSRYAELIVYMPYQSELDSIRELAANFDGGLQRKYAWINFADDTELPYLQTGGYYNHLHVIRFEVPEADKEALKQRVLQAEALLIPFELDIKAENLLY